MTYIMQSIIVDNFNELKEGVINEDQELAEGLDMEEEIIIGSHNDFLEDLEEDYKQYKIKNLKL